MSGRLSYTIRYRGQPHYWGLTNKKEAYSMARELALSNSTSRNKISVYALLPGQKRGQLIYRCWFSEKRRKVIGEDR